ncbi:MAG: hypothetical protein WCZ72_07005 [Gemmobacter sp.]
MRNPIRAAGALALILALAACNDGYGYSQNPANNAAVRTVGGAAAGAVIADATGGSRTRGALIGAVAGGVSCGVPGLPRCH